MTECLAHTQCWRQNYSFASGSFVWKGTAEDAIASFVAVEVRAIYGRAKGMDRIRCMSVMDERLWRDLLFLPFLSFGMALNLERFFDVE